MSVTTATRALTGTLAMALALALCTALGVFSPQSAYADEEATLTLVTKYDPNGPKSKNIDGMALSAYKVASIGDNGAYVLESAYAGAGKKAGVSDDFNATMKAKDTEKLAAAMAEIAKGETAKATATSGSDGLAKLGKLDYGVYLVVQTGQKGTAEGYKVIEPFLINVPQFGTPDGTVFKVEASIKTEPEPEKKEPEKKEPEKKEPEKKNPETPAKNSPSSTSTSSTPKTGDSMDPGAMVGITAIGLAAMLLALLAARRRRSE